MPGLAPGSIADVHGKADHRITAKLIGEIGHVMVIELRLHEDIVPDEVLQRHAGVNAEVSGIA